ncbi:Uncharacterised protein [Mycobacteroides abscessus subsp. abscessus]|nr:Uncharacterised protein [Mycobacteroides abscessus subsp. abscessus]
MPSGSASSMPNSEASASAAIAPRSATPVVVSRIAVPPITQNHTTVTPLGTSSTPTRNSRIVRPREMRARKVPTNGAQDSHHAQ